MLENLHVKNLAIIDNEDIDFTSGLNILTGETGAGKSIIIGSINLALGGRFNKEMLKNPSEPALIEMTFSLSDKISKILLENDISILEDNITITRKINNGRSTLRVNGETISASLLKEVSKELIDIHGQHDHQSLIHRSKQLEILDNYCFDELNFKKIDLKNVYIEYKNLLKELSSYTISEEERVKKIDFLNFEIEEIENSNLDIEEDLRVEENLKINSSSKDIMISLENVLSTLKDNDINAIDLIECSQQELKKISKLDDTVADFSQQLAEINSLSEDLIRQIVHFKDSLSYDPEKINNLERRLDEINHLKLKYGNTIEKILDYKCEKENERLKLINYNNALDKINTKILEKKNKILSICNIITDTRKKYSLKLEKEIVNGLKNLNFLDVKFKINFEKKNDFNENGNDLIEFMISTNPGQPLLPMSSVASGGELSRIMLVIKTILSKQSDIECLIFDEIDTGISGRTAQLVANKMCELSKIRQIICITHLPQIASMADTHFLIEKKSESGNTNTHINKLNDVQIIEELSRMLGGTTITNQVRKSAKEMKLLAKEEKIK